ncbi:YceD family protein [Gaopeijia maritima]|uniref:DUF177 domain-containing protein n=1 Tax=Gaopeijia maritima TaxID=3119007 RepID=A0ABU9EC81_9BACT
MPKLDLPRLERDGSLSFESTVPPDDPLWEGSGLRFDGDVAVRGRASVSGTGEIIVQMHVDADRMAECRRCLEPVRVPLEKDFIVVYGDAEEMEDDDGSDVRPLSVKATVLELGEALREEIILASDRWVECRTDCAGLCPICGVNWNEQTCECSPDEPDPRWDALRALQSE